MGESKKGLGETSNNPEVEIVISSDSEMSVSEDSSDSDDSSDMSEDEDEQNSEDENENEVMEEDKEDDDDELVKAIKQAKEKTRNHPPDINVDDCISDISFHPVNELLAVATIMGDVMIYSYTDEANNLIATHELHSKACRDIEFSQDGSILFSSSKDKSIMLTDMETGKLKSFYENAHEEPIFCLTVINENIFTTGDDSGVVRMWDMRHRDRKPIFSLKPSEEHISDMITNSAHKYLVCSSGDGALSTINMNARKIYVQTEEYDSELTCLGLFRSETKILAGSSKGRMYLFNWGEFGLHTDEFIGLKQSISCMLPVTENIVVVSGEDGVLRATHLFPHKHLGVAGQHSMPVEKIDISNNGHYIASFSHDNDIRFWNYQYFEDLQIKSKKQNKRKDLKNNLPSSKMSNSSDFFAGMS